MSTPTLIISEPQPLRKIAMIACLLLMTITAHWFYNKEQNKTLFAEVDKLETELAALENTHNTLRQQFIKTTNNKRTIEQQLSEQQQINVIQQGTEQQLQLQLNELQNQVMALKKELMFYQNITQGNSSSKLQIRETFISKSELPDVYRYRIVITQGKKVSTPITGKVTLTLKTNQDNNIEIAEHDLSLRHNQVIEGSINLTEALYKPEGIIIKITQGKKTRLNETVNWQISP